MLYWIIPYLVAYYASDSGSWKYGPEHVFKAEVYSNITIPIRNSHAFSEVFMKFACRPKNSTLIQCRIDSARLNKYVVISGSDLRQNSIFDEEFGLDDVVFQIQFDEEGISRVWFLNNNNSFVINMIRAIIGTMNTGISIADKKTGNYVSQEKSVMGICDTSFTIKNELLSEEEEQDETEIDEYEFEVPLLGDRTDDETIVIEKDRNLSECVKKTPYLFGSTEEADLKAGRKWDVAITYSQSRIYLGEKSFSTYTENLGTIVLPFIKQSGTTKMIAGEMIRVSLESIRPAKDEHWNTENLVNVGAGVEPGTPWPGRD